MGMYEDRVLRPGSRKPMKHLREGFEMLHTYDDVVILTGGSITERTIEGGQYVKGYTGEFPLRVGYWTEPDFESNRSLLYQYQRQASSHRRDEVLENYEDYEKAFWEMADSPVLFFDHLGMSGQPAVVRDVVSIVLDRIAAKAPTVLSFTQTDIYRLDPRWELVEVAATAVNLDDAR